jgi:capsular polysaccharide biosynthesis protein
MVEAPRHGAGHPVPVPACARIVVWPFVEAILCRGGAKRPAPSSSFANMSVARGRSRAGRRASRDGRMMMTAPAFEELPPIARPVAPEGVHRHLAMAWRRRPTLFAATLVAGVMSFAVAHGAPQHYETSARVLVGPLGGEAKTLQASSQLARTYAELATTRAMRREMARRLGVPPGAIDVHVDVDGVTRFLTIHARDADPARAAAVANAQAAALVALSTRKGAGGARAGRLQVSERAVPSKRSASPSPAVIAVVAAAVGLLAAFLIVLLADRVDDSVRSAEDAEAATGAPCVGHLSRAALRAARDGSAAAPGTQVATELGALAAKLRARPGQSLLVIAMDGDATALAGNLADALATQGSRVALVDVGDDTAPGGDVETDRANAGAPAVNGNGNGSGPAPTGAVQRMPRPLLRAATGTTARRAEAALDRLEAGADLVVLHASRLERSPTALAWARVADGTVLVAERNRTAVPELRATAETLRLVSAPVVGTVLAEPATAWPRLRRRLRPAG